MTLLHSGLRRKAIGFAALVAVALAATLASGASAIAQEAYPARPLRIIVPFPPGGPTDTSARMIGKMLSDRLGQPVVIENRAGAGSTLGTLAAAQAAPDGYTLLWAGTSYAIAAAYGQAIGYDPLKSFSAIGEVVRGQQVMIGRLNLGFATLKELVAASKANPGRMTYGSVGVGSAPHLVAELFKSVSGASLLHVPYKGGSQAMNDLQGGHIDVMFNTISLIAPQVKARRVKGYAVTGKSRSPLLPELPTTPTAAWLAPGVVTDPTDPTGKWAAVKVKPLMRLPHPVSLARIKAEPGLANCELIRLGRLSVAEMTGEEWEIICKMGGL